MTRLFSFIHYYPWTLSLVLGIAEPNKLTIESDKEESESAGGGREEKREREGWKISKSENSSFASFSWRRISKVFSWTFTPLARVATRTSPLTLNTELGAFPATRNI